MNIKKISEILKDREFVSVGTCDFEGAPNVAPKFLLKVDNECIYLIDYSVGRTFRNIKINPKVSLSIMDLETIVGYQLNGSVGIIDEGPLYHKIIEELSQKEVELSAKRVIEALGKGKRHKNFEVSLSQTVIILKVHIDEIVELSINGETKRHKI